MAYLECENESCRKIFGCIKGLKNPGKASDEEKRKYAKKCNDCADKETCSYRKYDFPRIMKGKREDYEDVRNCPKRWLMFPEDLSGLCPDCESLEASEQEHEVGEESSLDTLWDLLWTSWRGLYPR